MLKPLDHTCSFSWVSVLERLPSDLDSRLFLEFIVLRGQFRFKNAREFVFHGLLAVIAPVRGAPHGRAEIV